MNGRSPLASKFVGRQENPRAANVFGVVIHTTGSGVVYAARRKKIDPLDYAVKVYTDPNDRCGHYVVGWDGTIVQIVDETLRAQHVGYDIVDHRALLDGSWVKRVSVTAAALWKARWPNVHGPAYLFPGTSPNSVYIGIEMIPLEDDADINIPAPMAVGLTFTKAQHVAVAKLVNDIIDRWNLPANEVLSAAKGRMVSHEDLQPLSRSDFGGGWDPGALREVPRFDYNAVRSFIVNLRAGV